VHRGGKLRKEKDVMWCPHIKAGRGVRALGGKLRKEKGVMSQHWGGQPPPAAPRQRWWPFMPLRRASHALLPAWEG